MLRSCMLLALIVPALAAPASAGADGGNVALSQSATHARYGGGTWDTSTPLVIGDQGAITYTVSNGGSIPATVTFTLAGSESATTSFPVFRATAADQSQTCHFPPWTLPITCTRQVPAGATWAITVWAAAYTPGTLDLDASIVTEGADDDPADDRLATTIASRCSIEGTPGDDVITVSRGQSVCGGGGNDVFIAHGDNTAVFGGSGDDTLYEEHGETMYWLGAGTDTFSVARSRNPDHICASAAGRWSSGGNASPEDGGAWGYGADIIVGSPFGDVIKGNRGDEVIFGGGGRDIINPGRGDDAVFAGRGDDRMVTRDGSRDEVIGGRGSDRAVADRVDDVTSATTSYDANFFDVACNG